MASKLNSFDNGAALAAALADAVAGALGAAISARGQATIAVSGGSTPKAFFQALSTRPLDWSHVTVTLVDERFVAADHPRSNHLLVSTHLLQNAASSARFVPLFREGMSAEQAAVQLTDEFSNIHPFDVVVLGMGNDGHTASFFPGGSQLAEAIDLALPRRVMTMEAEAAGETRLTFSFPSLEDARLLVLHIEGAEKMAVLQKAQSGDDENQMPIRAVLNRAKSKTEIYWAP
ncbi:MAG: 6-phosphogluconolactonase [Allorhizobium sp.]